MVKGSVRYTGRGRNRHRTPRAGIRIEQANIVLQPDDDENGVGTRRKRPRCSPLWRRCRGKFAIPWSKCGRAELGLYKTPAAEGVEAAGPLGDRLKATFSNP